MTESSNNDGAFKNLPSNRFSGEEDTNADTMTTSLPLSPLPEESATTKENSPPDGATYRDGLTDPANALADLTDTIIGLGGRTIADRRPPTLHPERQPVVPPPGPGLDTIDYPSSGTNPTSSSSSFAQLAFRTFETYMNEARASDQFPPLQVLQQINLCGPYGSEGLARLTGPSPISYHHQGRPLEPIAIRHIHSTPLQHTPSILDDEDEYEPPPVGLDILNRSRSTPLSTSKNSAFGTILRTNSNSIGNDRHNNTNATSAFTMMPGPYPMLKASSRSAERDNKAVIFNPIKHDVEMEGEGEMTSIEVVDLPRHLRWESTTSLSGPKASTNRRPKMSAASRAAKFLTDVRNLGMRHKAAPRGGRDNPARPPSASDESTSSKKASGCADEETISSKSSGNSSEKESMPATARLNSTDSPVTGQKLAGKQCYTSDNDAGTIRPSNQSSTAAKNSFSTDTDESPSNVPSHVYERLGDSPRITGSNTYDTSGRNEVSIQVNHVLNPVSGNTDHSTYSVSSPEPSRAGSTTPQSQDSPELLRFFSSTTSSNSGHVTHATTTSHSSGHDTNLSTISETDREVMELNSSRKCDRRNSGDTTLHAKTDRIELSLASGRNVRFGEYVELVTSPSPENGRDGASVQADRFFTRVSDSNEKSGVLHKLRGLGGKSKAGTSHSPNTVSSASVNTSSSASSMGDEPPKIVSYLDRKQVSDLTSALQRGGEAVERSSPRAGLEDREVRDSSPSEQILVEDSEVLFEGAHALKSSVGGNPRPLWTSKGLPMGRKMRSLPPRSPHKGFRSATATPPPRGGSPAYGASPPRPIVDSKGPFDPSLLSKPYALTTRAETTPGGSDLQLGSNSIVNYTHIPGSGSDPGSHEVVRLSPIRYEVPSVSHLPRGSSPIGGLRAHSISPVGGLRARTYEESSIEILKTDSKEDTSSCPSPIPLVTPEKGSQF
jgi:hypothetical protein